MPRLPPLRLPPLRPGHPYLAGAPLLIAHRGGAALAPENTMEAFRGAVDRWAADMLELDVRITSDGELVVIHDPSVDRTTDGSGPVEAMPWARVRELDAGHTFRDPAGEASFRGQGVGVPRLDEVFEAFPRIRLNVEIKAAAAAGPVVELIRRHGAEHRALVASAIERNRRDARGYRGAWGSSRRQLLLFWALHRTWFGRAYTPAADVFQVPIRWRGCRVLTPRFVEEAHGRNIPVHVWTVDDPPTMRRLLAWGVDGIQSDRPDLLGRVLTEEVGRPPPPGAGRG